MSSLLRAASAAALPRRAADPAAAAAALGLSKLIRLEPFAPGHLKAVAAVPLGKNTVVNTFRTPVRSSPTMHTVCLDANVHVAPTQGAEYISHACANTNTKIVVVDGNCGMVVVTKPVAAGEDLSFNYETTEWALSCPFECACPSCMASGKKRVVRGFAFLNSAERQRIMSETTPYIRRLAAKQQQADDAPQSVTISESLITQSA